MLVPDGETGYGLGRQADADLCPVLAGAYPQTEVATLPWQVRDLDMGTEAIKRITGAGLCFFPAGMGFGRTAPGSQLDLGAIRT